jgi:hypothetical protein
MKEQDAKTKWCPMKKLKLCIASDCMIWRWNKVIWDDKNYKDSIKGNKIVKTGYCGLGGKP